MVTIADRPSTLERARLPRSPYNARGAVGLDPVTRKWVNAIVTQGGVLNQGEITIIDGLVKALNASGIGAKMVALYPMMGISENSFGFALYDTGNKGKAFVEGFTSGDVSLSGGLVGNGSTKSMSTNYKPNELGSSNNGGMGWWGMSYDTGGTTNNVVMGCSNNGGTYYYALRSHPFPQADILWGLTANGAVTNAGGTYINPSHIYGQRESATLRRVCLNGSTLTTNTTSDATSGAGDKNIRLFGWDVGSIQYYNGR